LARSQASTVALGLVPLASHFDGRAQFQKKTQIFRLGRRADFGEQGSLGSNRRARVNQKAHLERLIQGMPQSIRNPRRRLRSIQTGHPATRRDLEDKRMSLSSELKLTANAERSIKSVATWFG
jgi:hypothetical protein